MTMVSLFLAIETGKKAAVVPILPGKTSLVIVVNCAALMEGLVVGTEVVVGGVEVEKMLFG